MNKSYKNILTIFSVIFFLEIISFLGFKFPEVRQIVFVIICLATLLLTIKDLRWGVFILLAELFIGSKGYLFYFSFGHFVLSIRIAIWSILMLVWFFKQIPNFKIQIPNFCNRKFLYFYIFIFLLFLGVINAFARHNALSNIYSDFNNWLYILAVLPIFTAIKSKDDWKRILEIFVAATLWLGFETLFLFFIFSHDLPQTANLLYSWIRNTLVGEITFVQYGFFRIFIQSQIYNLLAIFLFLPWLLAENKKETTRLIGGQALYFLLLTFNLTAVIICLSRSFWLGLATGLSVFGIYLIWKRQWRKLLRYFMIIISSLILSLILIVGILKFPIPAPLSGASALDLLAGRASQFEGEAAVSSRWNLLPVLWGEIKKAPLLGEGFGATATYKTFDPRALANNANGLYTTYAFEWGWLDIWIKIGFLGMACYLFLIAKIFWKSMKINSKISIGLGVGILSLAVIHFFTPYLNHPLGIGFLILTSMAINNYKEINY
ncbi:MAG: O-antigen ligase family protein [Patescibacteria group bacterium]|nr:O-antigen ligase family protein [Patescibacteria group bacterium]MDD4611005.1 O-antigen ligase family protein [Patescibacteria group bacterium]